MSSSGKIVVGLDGSANSRDALHFAGLLALKTGAKLLLANVVRFDLPSIAGWDDFESGAHGEAEELFNVMVSELGGEFDFSTHLLPAPSNARGLIDFAQEVGADAIVVGSSHRGAVGRTFIGSVGERLLHGAPCPVVVVPRDFSLEASTLQTVAVGFDGSPESDAAAQAALRLAKDTRSDLKLMAVCDPAMFSEPFGLVPEYNPMDLQNAHSRGLSQQIEQFIASNPPPPEITGDIQTGDAVTSIAAACESGIDLLVVGSRGYGPVNTVLLGTVTGKLIRQAPCPVMAVPRSAA